jgi:hypothetical protein
MRLRIAGIKDLKLGYVSAGDIVWVDVPYGNRFTMTTNVTNITYEGDNETTDIFSSADLSGTLGADKLSDDVILKAFDKTAVTSATNSLLSSLVNKRIYFGDNDEFVAPPVALLVTAAAVREDVDPEVATDVQVYIFKAAVRPFKPGDLANRAKVPFELEWSAKKTSTDIAGDALPSVPAGGATYALDILHPV